MASVSHFDRLPCNTVPGAHSGIGSLPEEASIEDDHDGEETLDQPNLVPIPLPHELLIYFQAEGIISEEAVPWMSKALEETDGVRDVKISTLEGNAIVQLIRTASMEAAGATSSLVNIMQGFGFAFQTLSLSCEDNVIEDSADM